jgi:hypothetical protein
VRLSVRDATVPRFNPLAEPARTVGFGKRDLARTVELGERDSKTGLGKREWDSARAVGFWKRDSARTVGFGKRDSKKRDSGNRIRKIHVLQAPSWWFLSMLCSCNSRASSPSTHSRTCTWAQVQQPQLNIVYSSCALKS